MQSQEPQNSNLLEAGQSTGSRPPWDKPRQSARLQGLKFLSEVSRSLEDISAPTKATMFRCYMTNMINTTRHSGELASTANLCFFVFVFSGAQRTFSLARKCVNIINATRHSGELASTANLCLFFFFLFSGAQRTFSLARKCEITHFASESLPQKCPNDILRTVSGSKKMRNAKLRSEFFAQN